jgi:hypothetical protein
MAVYIYEPCDAAVDGAALRGGLPGHALPRALRLDARREVDGGVAGVGVVVVVVGGGAVLARPRHCASGERERGDRRKEVEEEEGEVGGQLRGPLEVAVLKTTRRERLGRDW